ncbi:MAG TPA: hypothetical protein VFM93_03735 [Candidatus Limnocylindria bacterium]|nr:hypothetical protein [Candidatus Limnocylindria bacterium]
MRDDNGSGFFGVIEGFLALIGLVTLLGVLAVAASVVAWEMELRKSEEEASLPEPTQIPTA